MEKNKLIHVFIKPRSIYTINIYECYDKSFCVEEYTTKKDGVKHSSLFIKKDLGIWINYIKNNGYKEK